MVVVDWIGEGVAALTSLLSCDLCPPGAPLPLCCAPCGHVFCEECPEEKWCKFCQKPVTFKRSKIPPLDEQIPKTKFHLDRFFQVTQLTKSIRNRKRRSSESKENDDGGQSNNTILLPSRPKVPRRTPLSPLKNSNNVVPAAAQQVVQKSSPEAELSLIHI